VLTCKVANIYDVKGMSAAQRWPGVTRTGALYETHLTRQIIISPGRHLRLVEKLFAMEKWYWTETQPLEERAPGTNPIRSLDYAVTGPGCYYMLGQCAGVQKQLILTQRMSY